MRPSSTAAGIYHALVTAFDNSERTAVVGESLRSGLFAGLTERFPDRVYTTPVADRAAVGLAIGLALSGTRVVVDLSSSGRLFASLEPLAELGAIATAGEFLPNLVIRVPTGGQAGPHIDRAAADLLVALPGLRVVAPSTAPRVVGTWRAALAARGPVVILEPRELLHARIPQSQIVDGEALVDLGAADLVRTGTTGPGDRVTLLCWGTAVPVALAAAERLHERDLSARVLDLHSLAPLDLSAIGEHVRATGRAVLVQPPEGGLSQRILHAALDRAFLHLESPLATVPAALDAIVDRATTAIHY